MCDTFPGCVNSNLEIRSYFLKGWVSNLLHILILLGLSLDILKTQQFKIFYNETKVAYMVFEN